MIKKANDMEKKTVLITPSTQMFPVDGIKYDNPIKLAAAPIVRAFL